MNKYIFEFSIAGSIIIDAENKEKAGEKYTSMSTEDVLTFGNSICSAKCVGYYNEDGSITYFDKE
jgi:hypothetical protein